MRKKERMEKNKGLLKVLPVIVVILLYVILVIVLSKVVSQKKVNFWSVTNEMVNADHTKYNYTLTIDTSSDTSVSNTSDESESKEDLENMEASDTEETASADATTEYNINSKHFSSVWSDASGVEDYRNTDVKCTLEINGYSSGDDFKSTLRLGCDGGQVNDIFDIIFVDGKYYLGVGNLKDGLKGTGVGSLVKLGNELPDGVRYLVIPEKEFVVLTGLNEKNGLGYLKTRDGAVEMFQRSLDVFLGRLQSYTDKKSLKKSKQDEIITCGFTSNNSATVFEALKNYLAYSTDSYKSQISDMVDDKYIAKEDKETALSEVDNLAKFSSKYLEVINAMSDADVKKADVKINAQITREGKKTYKPNYRVEFNKDNKHFTVGFSGECNIGVSGDKIVAPEETSLDISEYENGGEMWKGYFIKFLNYFNVIGIDLESGTTQTVGQVATTMLDSLCTTLNTAHKDDAGWVQVTRGTLSDYIEAHSEDDDIVKSFLETYQKYIINTDIDDKSKK